MEHQFAEVKIPYSKNGNKDHDEKLLQPFKYILQVPGKNIRSKLARAFNYWLKIDEEKLNEIDSIIEMLHNASLLGIPVAHSIYGIPSTLNAANYVMIIALQKCIDLNHPEATKVYTEQLLDLHRGQGMEIYWRDHFICPTEEDYCEMTKKKTGGLFMLAIRLMQLFSENKQDFSKLTEILGLYFQMRDDFLNLYSKEFQQHKSFCEDLTEGKFSFPLIHAIRSNPEDTQIIQILRQRTKDVEVKSYCVSLLEKYGSFAYTKSKLEELHEEAAKEVGKLGGNPFMDEVLKGVFKNMC
ncbi:terpene synthase isoform X2 [Onthophagus taurus]|uniref:terpene synthase isoform X2 n=1 Tax=Onthophagus taurus TaxID=166361 RepID=UPI000C20F466|nr:geranylgeranyl pyrophosphate synthase isoform X2 [Onthophagus taurus]